MLPEIAHVSQRSVKQVKRLRRTARQKLGGLGPIEILPFRGHGTPGRFFVSGRVLEGRGITRKQKAAKEDGILSNLLASLQRLRSEEIPGVELAVRFGGVEGTTTTDDEGYFDLPLELRQPVEAGWHEVELEITRSWAGGERTRATGQVLVPPADAEFGVISDLDETVLPTSATDRLKMVRIVLFQNARTRTPFPGVSAFYRALKLGSDGRRTNPIFYVSRSPWNLYDLFEAFFALNDIPSGPLFLRELHLLEAKSTELGMGQGKLSRIGRLLRLYPAMKFVLAGDSGETDPEVFRQIVEEHPGRVRAVYLRDVSMRRRYREVAEIAEAIRDQGVPVVSTRYAEDAAKHAAQLGLVARAQVESVRAQAEKEAARSRSS